MLSLDEARLLHRLAGNVATGCVVEVGSFRGRSTVALALGSMSGQSVPVYAIEPHEPFHGRLGGEFGPEDRGAFYQTMLDTGCYTIVRLVNLSTEVVTPGWKQPVGLLWIDGDHSYEGVKRDFDCWLPYVHKGAAIVFDDSLNPEIGPRKLIDELTASGRFKETEHVGKVTVIREVA